ncbi:hypothetical protein [Legionella gresilensis]|uniref:hypothetical protein n=1 Tax=Legionella gresilensis TaxID=91823 RepID=UPI001040EC7A|nr:hypothetical protein [Legionella gresilensis]
MYKLEFFPDSNNRNKIKTPKLYWEYGVIADLQSKIPLSPELIQELTQHLIPEIQLKIWPKKGEPLVKCIIDCMKKGFVNNHPTITFILNPDIKSMSYPLIFNAEDYIALPPKKPKYGQEDLIYAICTLLMFRYIEENFAKLDDHSVLIKKYQQEGTGVTNRLFPFVLIQYAYIENNLIPELETIKSTCVSPAVIRAWEIIEKEGIKPFLDELKNYELNLNQQVTSKPLEI